MWSYTDTAKLSAGRIALSVSAFHDGALDACVPLVDSETRKRANTRDSTLGRLNDGRAGPQDRRPRASRCFPQAAA